jgi:hypothetical protein
MKIISDCLWLSCTTDKFLLHILSLHYMITSLSYYSLSEQGQIKVLRCNKQRDNHKHRIDTGLGIVSEVQWSLFHCLLSKFSLAP